jgi:hypothetical protein
VPKASQGSTPPASNFLLDADGNPVLDPETGRPILAGEGPKPDARLAVLEAIGLAMRGMDQSGGGPIVRNNALADLIAARRAMRAQEITDLPPLQNVVASDSKGLSPSSELPPKPPSTVDFETGRQGTPLGGEMLSEDPFEQLIPVAVDGPLERQFVPALDEFGNPKQAYAVDEYGNAVLDAAGNPVPTGETIPAVTVDRFDPQLGAYVTTAPDPLRPVSNAPVFEQTLTGETHQAIDPATGQGLTEPVYENVRGQVVRRGPPTYYVGRQVQGADGATRIEVDTSRPVVVLERSRAGSDGNRSAESRVFLTPRKDGTYQVLTMNEDGTPSYLRATDADVQRLLAQGFTPTNGSLDVQRPVMPESPEALARSIVETRAGTVSDGSTYRVGVDSPEAKADIIAQVEQLRKFGSVEDLRSFFEELGSARLALDDVGAGPDNAIARGQMAYAAFVDSAPAAPPQPRSRPELTPNAVREERIRRLVSPSAQTVSAGGQSRADVVAPENADYAPSVEIRSGAPDAGLSETLSPFTAAPESFAVPAVSPAATGLDILSGLRRFNPDLLDSSPVPATAGAGMMDFTITPSGQATLASSALDDLLGQLRSASPATADVAPGSLQSAETFYPRLPDTFFNQYATASADVAGPEIPAAAAERRPWTRGRGVLDQPLADRVRAARNRRMTGLGMPTQSSFDQMMGGLQRDFATSPAPEENVRAAVEAIMAGNAERRVSEQGRILESAQPTDIGPESSVRSSEADRASTAAAAAESEDTAKMLRGGESVMPQEAGLTRDQLRKMAIEGLGGGVRAPLAFKSVEMRSSQARPGASTLEKMADSEARIEALRDSLETDYPDPAAVQRRLSEISDVLNSGAASSSDRAGLRAERTSLREKLADSEMPGYMEARNSALEEIANAETAAREAQDGFSATSMGAGSVADAQQAILNKLMSSSGTFNEQDFFKAAEDLFGSTSPGGAVDAPSVFNAIRKAARGAGLPEPSDSDIIFATLSDLQDPTKHAMGDRGLRAAADYIARGLNARTISTPLGPDAPLLAIGRHDRPKSVWEIIDEQFGRAAGPMLDTPSPAPPLPAVYDQFIPPFLRLQATRDNLDKAFQGMSIPEAEQALDQLNAAEAAARSVTLPPTQDPAVLANIIAQARDAGRRRLGNVPPSSRRPLTITQSDSQSANLAALEGDVAAARSAVESLTQDPTAPMRRQAEELEVFVAEMRQGDAYGGAEETAEQFAARSGAAAQKLAKLRGDLEVSRRYPQGEHPELLAARRELQEATGRLETARSQAPGTQQSMDPATERSGSREQREKLFALSAKRASLERTRLAAEETLAGMAGKSGAPPKPNELFGSSESDLRSSLGQVNEELGALGDWRSLPPNQRARGASLERSKQAIEEALSNPSALQDSTADIDPGSRTPSARRGGFVGGVEPSGRPPEPGDSAESLRETLSRTQNEIASVDAEIDALYSGQSSAALTPPRVERAPAAPAQLPASMYSAPSPVQLRSADDLRDAVRLAPDRIGYAFVVPKETAQALRSRVNPELARLKITRETGPEEVALSGLIPSQADSQPEVAKDLLSRGVAINGREIAGGIRFTNPSDLSRLPTDGSVEVLHLDKDGRPTFYDPAGMDMRNPTARELDDMRASETRDARSAGRMNEAAEDEAIAVSSRPPVPAVRPTRPAQAAEAAEVAPPARTVNAETDEVDPPAARPESKPAPAAQPPQRSGDSPQVARLAKKAQTARARAEAAEADARTAKAKADAQAEEARRKAQEPVEGEEPQKKPRDSVINAKNAKRLATVGGLGLAGYYFREPLGEFIGGDTADAAMVGGPVFGTGYEDGEDTNSSADRALSRVRRARNYGYHTSQNPLPR